MPRYARDPSEANAGRRGEGYLARSSSLEEALARWSEFARRLRDLGAESDWARAQLWMAEEFVADLQAALRGPRTTGTR